MLTGLELTAGKGLWVAGLPGVVHGWPTATRAEGVSDWVGVGVEGGGGVDG
jgi:hypothetical protein